MIDRNDPRLVGLRITVTDARRAGHCPRGIKTWCEQQGIDPKDFFKNGIPALDALAKNDALGERVIKLKLDYLDGR